MSTWDKFVAILNLVVGVFVLAWVVYRWFRGSVDTPGVLLAKIIVTPLLVFLSLAALVTFRWWSVLPLIVSGFVIARLWIPNIAGPVAGLLANEYDGGQTEPEKKGQYSVAESLRRRGDYLGAIGEIDAQLEAFPGDFDGECLKAEILVENLGELQRGVALMEHVAGSGSRPPNHRAYALTQVADWHLKFPKDQVAAREALEKIREWLPGTEHARKAAQRIAHLPGAAATPTAQAADGTEVERLETHLARHPDDAEAREALAKLYAEEGRVELAMELLDGALALCASSPRDTSRWLNLKADYAVQHAADMELGAATLRRIIEQFPGTAFATAAEQRIARLGTEGRRHKTRAAIQVPKFRSDLGLPDD